MRTLVEQTFDEAMATLKSHNISVHVLMGGENKTQWFLRPEDNAVLIGTQDMLLSRALNRGYAVPRARWPMEFGLLNSDCLWVLDEVQLMDAGLATTAQLQQFRKDSPSVKPSYSWWMSATLQPPWLQSVDTKTLISELEPKTLRLQDLDKREPLWLEVSKPVKIEPAMDEKQLAAFVMEQHEALESTSARRTTLVVVNTVKRANELFKNLTKSEAGSVEIRLVHSRFRPAERDKWRIDFLKKEAVDSTDRIIIATQVVEAGVDISASQLITDLAPWPSLVQRFGRVARYGGKGPVHVVRALEEKPDKNNPKKLEDEQSKAAAPYSWNELQAALEALETIHDVSARTLEDYEANLSDEQLAELYPYSTNVLLLRHELDELFDTTPDLTGADLDISGFIRSGDERDVYVFWRKLGKEERLNPNERPSRKELCAVPFLEFRKFVETRKKKDKKAFAWRFDYLDGEWVRFDEYDVAPGMTFLVSSTVGGYSLEGGFDAKSTRPVPAVDEDLSIELHVVADSKQDGEELSLTPQWQTIAEHGLAVAQTLNAVLAKFEGPFEKYWPILNMAARWHDLGKAHPAFVSLLTEREGVKHGEIAKAPKSAWRYQSPNRPIYNAGSEGRKDLRPGFRHELASALALVDLLYQVDPYHEALLGSWQDLFGYDESKVYGEDLPPIQSELKSLSADEFNLLIYLVASHHGKVRTGLVSTPDDQRYLVSKTNEPLPIRGIKEGDKIPSISLTNSKGEFVQVPETTLCLSLAEMGLSEKTGASWNERWLGLLSEIGPFALAWLEAVLRIADWRVSAATENNDVSNSDVSQPNSTIEFDSEVAR